MIKTLIGKNNYLFLTNDSNKEIEYHQTDKSSYNIKNSNAYLKNKNKLMVVIFPDKSIIYNIFLPDNIKCLYRPSFNTFNNILGDIVHDSYEYLKDMDDVYYKTDTHINFKGAYEVYKNSLKYFNKLFKLNIVSKDLVINKKYCENLNSLNVGAGDLASKINCGDLILGDITDSYYYSEQNLELYYKFTIKNENIYNMKFYNYEFEDKTNELDNKLFTWEIVSNYIIITNNINALNDIKILIFYDSFLLSTLALYMETFKEIIFIKRPYNINFVNKFKTDYIIEFKVERFLNNV